MPRGTSSKSISIGDLVMQGSVTRTADGGTSREVTLPVALPVGSWVKTDANTAAGTLTGGHGLTSGTFDVYWTGGMRYGVTGTITVNAIALDLGSGDDYPASADTTVVVSKQTPINMTIDGDELSFAALQLWLADQAATSDGHATFKDAAADVIKELPLNANEIKEWDIEGGATNDFAGDVITTIHATQSNVTYPATLKIGTVEDATP